MSFAPVLPFTGITGWAFLERTQARQKSTFDASPALKRDEAYFREKIGGITTAEALVKDRRLLTVALGAFGLDGDINNRFYIRKVLEEGTLKTDSLANKLADKQYAAMSAAFGFDLATPRTQISTFADKIVAAWKQRGFETAVGVQNNDMRLALNARRELAVIAGKTMSDNVKWLTVLGSPPLRQFFERALNLPQSFVAVDLDRQVATLRLRTEKALGNGEIAQFSDPARVDKMIRRFMSQSDIAGSAAGGAPTVFSGASAAVQLLQMGSFGANRMSLRL
jgi:Protein of unknown function (DUF1217)